jgi:nitroreductase
MSNISPESVLQLIKTRRTVRKFDPAKPVNTESLKRILEAGTWAPYGPYHPQGWKFIALKGKLRDRAVSIITQSKTILKFIRTAYESSPWAAERESKEEHEWKEFARDFAKTLGNAPVMIVSLVPQADAMSIRGHNLGSAWAAVQNMMLQTQAEGLNCGVITFHSPKVEIELIESLGLSHEEWIVAFSLNIGHASEIPPAAPRLEGLYEIRE